nr:insulin-like growth factor-binding protein complex acid labile subunit [Crassostrea gigas]
MCKITLCTFLVLRQLLFVIGKTSCPSSCTCTKTVVDCRNKQLLGLPKKLPTNMERLYLGNNQLYAIGKDNFCAFPHLVELQLQNNSIASLSPFAFSGECLPKLQTLRLENNKITVIKADTFFNLSSLVNITLTNNELAELNPRSFEETSLEFLHLGGNKLREIPILQNLESLQDLILEGNIIRSCTFHLVFRNMTKLKRIGLSNNNIQNLDGDSFENLKQSSVRKFELARNNITKISNKSFLPLSKLQSLKLGLNPITDGELCNALEGLQQAPMNSLSIPNMNFNGLVPSSSFRWLKSMNLSTLDLSFNEFYTIPAQSFEDLTQLNSLDLSNCGIRDIHDDAFSGLQNLNNLILSNNFIENIPSNLPKRLMFLYMAENNVGILNNNIFSNLTLLKRLHLGNNKILTLFKGAFSGLVNLQDLQLHGNKINTLPKQLFAPLTNLTKLQLQQNRLTTIQNSSKTFSSLTSLKYLNLSDNGCSFLPITMFSSLKSLQELQLKGNKLGKFLLNDAEGKLFSGLNTLKILDLSNNQIHTFSSRLFRDMINLEILNLEDNWIPGLNGNVFSTAKHLESLVLSNNMISLVNEDSLTGLDSLKEINFNNNPFACTCDLRWFRSWINKTKTNVRDKKKYQCHSPQDWKGKPLLSFDETKIECNQVPVKVAVGVGFLVTILQVCVYLYRMHILFYWYTTKKRFFRCFGRRNRDLDHMDYDACIINSENPEDYEWIKTHLLPDLDKGNEDDNYHGKYKIYFGDRDTPGSADMMKAMVDVMETSRKIIFVVSKHLKTYPLINLFIGEAIHLKGKSLSDIIIITVGNVSFAEIPRLLHSKVRIGDHVEWRDDDIYRRVFKVKMEEKLKINTL